MIESLTRRRNDLIAIGLLFVAATPLFAGVLFGPNRLFIRDLTRYYYPTKRLVREVIRGGEFPYWNRAYSAGQPMAANPEYEVFYPPQWLILLPDYDLGFRLHILIHIYAGLLGMYVFLRSMKIGIAASWFGGVVFGIGGLLFSMVNLLPILFCLTWLPFVLLFARRCILHPNLRDFSIASLFLALQALSGEPTTMLQTWFLIGCYAAYRAWSPSQNRARLALRNGALVAALVVAGLLAGAAQFIPAIEHVGDSIRSRGFDYDLVTAWSMPYVRPLELLYPNLFGHIYRDGTWYWGGALYARMGSPFLFSIYLGILTIALCMAGFGVRPPGGRLVVLLVICSTVIALGGKTPLFRILFDVGLARSIRYPEKFALFGLFALIVFASIMLDRALRGDRRVLDAAIGFCGAVTAIAAVVSVLTFTPLYGRWFRTLWDLTKSPNAGFLTRTSEIDWLIATARGAIVLALLFWLRSDRARRLCLAALAVFVVADLSMVMREMIPTKPKSFFTAPPIASRLLPDRASYRLFHEADWYGQSEVARKFFGTGDAVYWIVRGGMFPMTPASWGFQTVLERDYDKTALLPTVDLVDAMWKVKQAGQSKWRDVFMRMSNAWYRTEYKSFEGEWKRTNGRLVVSEPLRFVDERHSPRYYFAEDVVTIRNLADFTKRITETPPARPTAYVFSKSRSPARGTVVAWRESANRAAIDVISEGSAFLVASVTPHRYWSATIDGKPAKLEIANIGYQGLLVPAGRHRVEMRYRNRLVDISVLISLVSISILIAMAVFSRRVEILDSPSEIVAIPAEPQPALENIDEHPGGVADDVDPRVG